MKVLICLLELTVFVTLIRCEPSNDLYYDPEALQQDITNSLKPFVHVYAKPDVCYEHLGCFSKVNGTFPFLEVQPESPETIGTEFHLYTRQNQKEPVLLSYLDTETLTTSLFDSAKPTVVICHGFNENAKKDWNLNMKNTFLQLVDANVILLDWGKGAVLPFYAQAVVNSELVGRQLALMLELFQNKRGLNIETVHILGYSLGAHLAGFAGKTLFQKYGKKFARISGMDPAGPIFEVHDEKVHLSSADAQFVDVVHTSAGGNLFFGELGITKAIGHVDFYPNGGKDQPNCGWFDLVCSHRRGVELYLESMSESCRFQGYPCNSYKDYVAKKCQTCDSGCSILGLYSYGNPGRGSLYLTTNTAAPYCNSS